MNEVWMFYDAGMALKDTAELLNLQRKISTAPNVMKRIIMIGDECNSDIIYKQKNLIQLKPDNNFWGHLETLIVKYSPNVILLYNHPIYRRFASVLATKYNFGIIADCIDGFYNDEKYVFTRIAQSGNLSASIQCKSKTAIVTINTKSNNCICVLGEIFQEKKILLKSQQKNARVFFNNNAKIVLGLGRGVSPENYILAKEISERLNLQIGVTKPLADSGAFDRKLQIGYSGNQINAEIYIALGISGSLQHLYAIPPKTYIFAVNNDSSAPIFDSCDYGVITDANLFLRKVYCKLRDE